MTLDCVTIGARERRGSGLLWGVFDFDPRDFAEEFRTQGYVLIKGGVTPEFIAYAVSRLEACRAGQAQDLSAWEIKNKKQQYLFEFPEDNKLLRGTMDMVAAVTGMAPESVTLSERHLKVYAPAAPSNPPPHKDRYASTIAVGIPLFMPADSSIVLYPDQSRETNIFDSSEDWRNSFSKDELPENALAGIEPVKLHAGVGDVVIFEGSSIYHERINGANAVMLYLKLNDMHLDPLAEDPFVSKRRMETTARLAMKSDTDLLDSTIMVSPRLIRISRHYTRNNWRDVLFGQIAGGASFQISEGDFELLRALDGGETVREALAKIGVTNGDTPNCLRRVRRLADLGGLDILS